MRVSSRGHPAADGMLLVVHDPRLPTRRKVLCLNLPQAPVSATATASIPSSRSGRHKKRAKALNGKPIRRGTAVPGATRQPGLRRHGRVARGGRRQTRRPFPPRRQSCHQGVPYRGTGTSEKYWNSCRKAPGGTAKRPASSRRKVADARECRATSPYPPAAVPGGPKPP